MHAHTGIDIVPGVKPKRPTAPPIKPLEFLGSSRDDLAAMPANVRHDIGVELMRVQFGGEPKSFKPMSSVGAGAYAIRVRDESGAYRVIYVAKFAEAVYVIHAFQKKARKTPKAEIELARKRYRAMLNERKL